MPRIWENTNVAPGSPGTAGIFGSATGVAVITPFFATEVRDEAVVLAVVADVEPDDHAVVVDSLGVDDVRCPAGH